MAQNDALKASQLEAARLIVAGKRFADVLTELAITRRTLERWRKQKGFQAEMERQSKLRDERLGDLLAGQVLASYETLVLIRDSGKADPGQRRAAATDLLNRLGHGPTKRVEAAVEVTTDVDYSKLTREERATLRALHAKASSDD